MLGTLHVLLIQVGEELDVSLARENLELTRCCNVRLMLNSTFAQTIRKDREMRETIAELDARVREHANSIRFQDVIEFLVACFESLVF